MNANVIKKLWWKFNDLMPYWITLKTDKIRWWFNPRQKWVFKKIPNHWIDKSSLFEIVIFEAIKHYVSVEGEDCFNTVVLDKVDEHFGDYNKKFGDELKEHHQLLTVKLPALEIEQEEEYDKVPKFDIKNINDRKIDYEKTYGRINQLEKEIDDLKTKIMTWAISRRNDMWT